MKSKLTFAMMGAFMAMAHDDKGRTLNECVIGRQPKRKIIPAGCKEYFFTKSGSMYTTKPAGYVVVFECIASNDKAAQNKFDKWYDAEKGRKEAGLE